MSLDSMLNRLDRVSFQPRTLLIKVPENVGQDLSVEARGFFSLIHDDITQLTILDWTTDSWKHNDSAKDFFFQLDDNVRAEILAFLTVFVHEYSHRIDFLISPFGLHYYGKTILEYLTLQKFIPIALDDPRTVDQVRYLVNFGKTNANTSDQLAELWHSRLKWITHTFFAWGDVNPKRIYKENSIKNGWGNIYKEAQDFFGINLSTEPITVLDHFYTFRIPDDDKFKLWYINPLTIFETKAIVNSLNFILHLLSERGTHECLNYFEKVYLDRRSKMPVDYFFLLDSAARIFGLKDFHTLLKQKQFHLLKTTLTILSSMCWYALQAPPHTNQDDVRSSNPILRLWLAFTFLSGVVRKQIDIPAQSAAEMLLHLDKSQYIKTFHQATINEVNTRSTKYLLQLININKKDIWNPYMKKHFNHILSLMKPHIIGRNSDYVSFLGNPDNGNPLLNCRTEEDWELAYDDYEVPEMVREWFEIRHDLLFAIVKPKEETLAQLDSHFLAFLIPYNCECGAFTIQWVSRWFTEANLVCGSCGKQKLIDREEFTMIACSKD